MSVCSRWPLATSLRGETSRVCDRREASNTLLERLPDAWNAAREDLTAFNAFLDAAAKA